ncbi:hypothetical protein ACSBR1_025420 [Camellia fascicularis]
MDSSTSLIATTNLLLFASLIGVTSLAPPRRRRSSLVAGAALRLWGMEMMMKRGFWEYSGVME